MEYARKGEKMQKYIIFVLVISLLILLHLAIRDAKKSYRLWKLHQRMGECDGEIVKVIKEIPCQSEKSGLPVVAMKYKYKVQYQVAGNTYYGAYYTVGHRCQVGDTVHLQYVMEHHSPHLLRKQRER